MERTGYFPVQRLVGQEFDYTNEVWLFFYSNGEIFVVTPKASFQIHLRAVGGTFMRAMAPEYFGRQSRLFFFYSFIYFAFK